MQAAKRPKRLIQGLGCPGIIGFVRNGLSLLLGEIREFPKTRDTFLGGPYNKDYSILGSILGHPYSWKLPCGRLMV